MIASARGLDLLAVGLVVAGAALLALYGVTYADETQWMGHGEHASGIPYYCDPTGCAAIVSYNRAFDRGPGVGSNAWNTTAPDGAISLGDVLAIAAQFGHSC